MHASSMSLAKVVGALFRGTCGKVLIKMVTCVCQIKPTRDFTVCGNSNFERRIVYTDFLSNAKSEAQIIQNGTDCEPLPKFAPDCTAWESLRHYQQGWRTIHRKWSIWDKTVNGHSEGQKWHASQLEHMSMSRVAERQVSGKSLEPVTVSIISHCLYHLYTVKPRPPGAMRLRTRGHDFELPIIK